jgi:membrane associated rhomboid family serine protease
MLEDRHYMRSDPFGRGWWSVTSLLIIGNVVAFILQSIIEGVWPVAQGYLALSWAGMSHGYVWQFLTFQFMHGGWVHLIFNCLAIFTFGRDVEQALGRKSYVALYLSSGALGGLLQILLSKVLSVITHNAQFEIVGVVGASAGVFGLIAAFATLTPDRPLTFLLIPVTIRAKYLLIFEAVFALLGIAMSGRSLSSEGSQIAHAAHLGGMVTGIIFIRYALQFQWPEFRLPKRRRAQKLVKVPTQASARWARKGGTAEDLPPEEFLSKEVDPILDKISAQGIQSLTERERRILQAAKDKMAKR